MNIRELIIFQLTNVKRFRHFLRIPKPSLF